MPRGERYYVGPAMAKRLPDVVRRVDEAILGGGKGGVPTVLQVLPQPGDLPVRLGKTTAAWNKGTTATIDLYELGTPPNETTSSATLANCVNKFANVASGKWVIVAQASNGYHYLISAECP